MNMIKKTMFGLVFALVLGAYPGLVLAIESTTDLQIRISELKTLHADMALQVKAGELSREKAQKKWSELVLNARADKENFFKEKMQKIESKYQEFAQKSPQRAVLVKERIDASIQVRAEMSAERATVHAKLQSGVINQAKALQIKKELLHERNDALKEVRSEVQAKIQQAKSHLRIDEERALERSPANAHAIKKETTVGFDPLGLNALEAFPAIKADIENARSIKAAEEAAAFQLKRKDSLRLQ